MADLLTNSLKETAKAERKEMTRISAVNEVQRLIADKGAEDMQILRDMGMATHVEMAINKEGDRLELERLESEHGDVFTIEEIKKVACRYALKFLRSDHYKGAIDPEMLSKLKSFLAGDINKAKLGYNCFVLAPPKAFRLNDTPRPIPADPILFYKMDDKHYKLIHKWGADLTPWRRVIGWKYRNAFNYFLLRFPFYIFPAIASFTILKKLDILTKDAWGAIPIVLTLAGVILCLVRTLGDDWGGIYRTWNLIWNDNDKPKF